MINSSIRNGKGADDNSDGSNDGQGYVSELMKRIIEKLRRPRIDWRKILNDFISEQVSDYSFSPPDRRFEETGFYLPDFNEKELVNKDVLFMVDTSGSVDDETLAAVYSELKGALLQHEGRLCGKLGFFDSEATDPVPMSSVQELMSIVPVGGGGTDFYSVFTLLDNKNETPSCIIIFTDGEASFPPESRARGIPVLWIIVNSNVTAPWGKTVIMNND
jgi:predicted metal-dependent peptidase